MKKFFYLLAVVLMVVATIATTTSASAYQGGWYFDNNPGGDEILYLDDGAGSQLQLYGTVHWCGARGASYATMRQMIASNYSYPGYVNWWIDRDCGYLARICVEARWGQVACSSYRNGGWWGH